MFQHPPHPPGLADARSSRPLPRGEGVREYAGGAAVIFDVDGVLLDLTPAEEDAFFHPFETVHGLTGLSRDWDSYRIRNDEDIIAEILERHFGRRPRPHELRTITRAYLDHLDARLKSGALTPVAIAGAEALLAALDIRGMQIGIATANILGAARLRLQHRNLWRYVDSHAHGADGGGAKRTVLARAIARSGLPPERIVYIGDNLNDVDAGLGNGTHFIGFAEDAQRRQKLQRAGARHLSANHGETLEIIHALLGEHL
jgi:phosphoglycolate phosphatase